ncbi:MAG: solute carrier family 13 (sodium-dependent dicarboxylate transporter), er 2/3/5 [Clostridia bacterium]|nr:solute carrier family 13 (sodium-dependent dicarboxylate transporter), er 2/3/5 [Clostridia bacterium]
MLTTPLTSTLRQGVNWRNILILLLAAVPLGLVNYIPLPADLSYTGARAMAVLFIAVTLWITEIVHPAVTALFILALLPLMQIITFEKALAGFADTSIILLIAIYILSAAMLQSGLDRRLAFLLLNLSRGSIQLNLLLVAVTVMAFTFLIPTSTGRAALMAPICVGIVNAIGLKPGSNVGKAIFLMVSFTSLIFSNSIMTGSLSMVYATGLFQQIAGYTWTYLSWMTVMLPGSLITIFLVWLMLLKVFPPELKGLDNGLKYIKEQLSLMGPLTAAEKKVAFLFLGMLAMWVTNFLHHLPVALPALLAATLSFFPGFNLHSWKEAVQKVDWGTVILFAGSLSLATGLTETGAMGWFATIAFGNMKTGSLAFLGLMVMLIAMVIRLGFNSVLAAATVILPMVLTLAMKLGLNPIWLGMIGAVASDLCMFLPTQSPSLLATYGMGFYSTRDTLKAGSLATLCLVTVTLIMAMFYWPLVGVAPQ